MNRSFRVPRRRGVTSVIAMLFLVLIGTLALGFYTSVTTATALSRNDRRTAKALMAAESGIQFMRNRLANVTIPPNTTSAQLLDELAADLLSDEELAGNLAPGTEIKYANNVITIPFICTDAVENSGFTVTVSDIGAVGEIVCTVKGSNGSGAAVSTKGVRLDFTRHEVESNIFDNAVAARSRFVMKKGSVTGIPGVSSDEIIKIMSASTKTTMGSAISMTGGTIGSALGGELAVVVEDSDPLTDNKPNNAIATILGTVHGTSNSTTIYDRFYKLTSPPEFPEVNTAMFAAYATNEYAGATGGVLKNVRIPAGTNPKFTGNVTIQGILYIESPNVVDFAGTSNLQGFVVFENAGTSAVNKINATGNLTYGNLPAGAEFDNLRTITGISMLAPTTALKFGGSVDSQVRGNMIVGRFENAGSADIQFEKGSILAMDPEGDGVILNGKTVKFASTGADFPPSEGLTYTSRFLPSKGSYLELN